MPTLANSHNSSQTWTAVDSATHTPAASWRGVVGGGSGADAMRHAVRLTIGDLRSGLGHYLAKWLNCSEHRSRLPTSGQRVPSLATKTWSVEVPRGGSLFSARRGERVPFGPVGTRLGRSQSAVKNVCPRYRLAGRTTALTPRTPAGCDVLRISVARPPYELLIVGGVGLSQARIAGGRRSPCS